VRAIVVSEYGGPEVLTLAERPDPEAGPGEVVVETAAIGVNFLDVAARAGQRPGALPFIPGHEGAGTVAMAGPGVSGITPGDPVAWAWPGVPSSYAERVAVPAQWIVPLPAGIAPETAAAVLIQGMTAHYLSQSAYPVQPGDTVLVHAGAGGVGQLLTQMAKLRGGRVICTVSTAQKEKLARDNGADEVIRYTETDFAAEIARLTGGAGVAAIYDGVGAATFDRNLASLAPRGVLAIYGQASGPIPAFDTARLIQAGSAYLTRTSLVHYARGPQQLLARATHVFDLVQSGELRTHIGGRYALADAASAHRELESRRSSGKLLLIP
jgi:NADPH2:quinone reductase